MFENILYFQSISNFVMQGNELFKEMNVHSTEDYLGSTEIAHTPEKFFSTLNFKAAGEVNGLAHNLALQHNHTTIDIGSD